MRVEEALEKQGITFLATNKSSIAEANKNIGENETILFAFLVKFTINTPPKLEIKPMQMKNKMMGVFVITDKKVLFANKILINAFVKQIPINKIQSMDSIDNIYKFGMLRISGITETITIEAGADIINKIKNIISENMD